MPSNMAWSSAACSKIRCAFRVSDKFISCHNCFMTLILLLVSIISTEVGLINLTWAYIVSCALKSLSWRSSFYWIDCIDGGRSGKLSFVRRFIARVQTSLICAIITSCFFNSCMIAQAYQCLSLTQINLHPQSYISCDDGEL